MTANQLTEHVSGLMQLVEDGDLEFAILQVDETEIVLHKSDSRRKGDLDEHRCSIERTESLGDFHR